jgi:hypothetical protein
MTRNLEIHLGRVIVYTDINTLLRPLLFGVVDVATAGNQSIAVAATMFSIFPMVYKLTSLKVLGVPTKSSPYQSTGLRNNILCPSSKLQE